MIQNKKINIFRYEHNRLRFLCFQFTVSIYLGLLFVAKCRSNHFFLPTAGPEYQPNTFSEEHPHPQLDVMATRWLGLIGTSTCLGEQQTPLFLMIFIGNCFLISYSLFISVSFSFFLSFCLFLFFCSLFSHFFFSVPPFLFFSLSLLFNIFVSLCHTAH